MAEVLAPLSQTQIQRDVKAVPVCPPAAGRSAPFKYYIHDCADSLRFQLIGDLAGASVKDLSGSWETARTIIRERKFVVDVSQLQSADREGRAWLEKMKENRAVFVPGEYDAFPPPAALKLSLLGRVLGRFSSGVR